MKTIKVLGTGCPKCQQTTDIIRQAVEATGVDVDIQKVEDIEKILIYDVLSTPAVVVDEHIVLSGRVPSLAEMIDYLIE